MWVRYLTWLLPALLLIGTASPQGTVEPGGYPINYGLAGQVVDASGIGISGVKVWIIGSEGGAFNTTTNATGYYGVDVPPGNYTITAELPGYSFTSSNAQVLTGTITAAQNIIGYPAGQNITGYPMGQNITGYPAGTAPVTFYQYGPAYAGGTGLVQGRVVDQSGAGIPFAGIRVDGFPASTQTDGQGNYRLTLSSGMHTLEPMKSGYGIPPRVVFVFSGQTTNFDMSGMRTVALGRGRQSF